MCVFCVKKNANLIDLKALEMVHIWLKDMITKQTPQKERIRLGLGNIYENQIKCTSCNTLIRSKYKHDFVTCPCGSVSVDGGSHYLKRSGNITGYEEMSTMFDDISIDIMSIFK